MKQTLLPYLQCPETGGELTLEIVEERDGEIWQGYLTSGEHRYPIIDGIPRFIDGIATREDIRNVYADSFGHQWTTYEWLRDEDEFEFFQITDLKKEDLAGLTVLDAGCGGGRVARIMTKYCGTFIGFDYSIAVERAAELCKGRENAHFVQCDVNKHPFKPETFDFVHSHGVLHHTPDTKKSFENLPPLAKPGALFYIALFRRAVLPLRISDGFIRGITNKLSIPTLDKVCSAMSHLHRVPFPIFFKRFFWFSLQKTHEIRKCCLYDWYGPTYHHEHSVEEVQEWFREAGIENPTYINAWPYCPDKIKYAIPKWYNNIRLGLLLGVMGRKKSSPTQEL